MTGKIIKVSPRGYGFISSLEKPFTRIFFHWTGLSITTVNFQELHPGDTVEFECIPYQNKGWRAIKIVCTNKQPANVED